MIEFFVVGCLVILLSLFSNSMLKVKQIGRLYKVSDIGAVRVVGLPSCIAALIPLDGRNLGRVCECGIIIGRVDSLCTNGVVSLLRVGCFEGRGCGGVE